MPAGALLCVDAPGLLYRAFFAIPDKIRGTDGRPVNALLGTVNTLLQVVEEHRPRAVAVCFGQEDGAYRTAAYPPYHAARPPMPDELREQFDAAPALMRALGWATFDHADLEADDLLGALSSAEVEAGGSALILTGDRDMFQCAAERVKVLLLRTGGKPPDVLGPAEVLERYGVRPEQVPDFIALRGDPSDGIPGAKGIGEKTAADLLRRLGTLEAAIAGAVREKPAVRRALLQQADELRTFRHIATLQPVEVALPPDGELDAAAGAAAAERIGMGRLAVRLRALAAG